MFIKENTKIGLLFITFSQIKANVIYQKKVCIVIMNKVDVETKLSSF